MTENQTPNDEQSPADDHPATGGQAPAGWYPDPNDETLLRYFDGTTWTEHTAPRYTTAAADHQAQIDAAKQAKAAEKARHREEAKAQRAADRDAKQAQKAAARAEELARYGNQTASQPFGTKMVRIYDKGYVRVGALLFGGSTPYEKLVSIEFSADVQKKTGVGRAAVGVMTLGANVALSSNKRGDVYLTIVTDRQTHVLHESPPTAQLMKAGHALEAAGAAVLKNTAGAGAGPVHVEPAQPPAPGPAASAGDDIAARLTKLEQLHAQGLITDDEHRERRQEILRDI